MRGVPSYFALIERALRDEGTSYHYLPAAEWSTADPDILDHAERAFTDSGLRVERRASWTTDAPFSGDRGGHHGSALCV